MATIRATVLVVLSILIQNGSPQDAPKVTYITPNLVKYIGGTVELTCAVENAKDYTLVWMKIDPKSKSNNFLVSTDNLVIAGEDRYTVHYDKAKSVYILKINNIKEIDAGLYQCQILVSAQDRISAEVELQVKPPGSK